MFDVGDLPVLTFGNCVLKTEVIKWHLKLYARFNGFSKSKNMALRFLSCCTRFLEHWRNHGTYMWPFALVIQVGPKRPTQNVISTCLGDFARLTVVLVVNTHTHKPTTLPWWHSAACSCCACAACGLTTVYRRRRSRRTSGCGTSWTTTRRCSSTRRRKAWTRCWRRSTRSCWRARWTRTWRSATVSWCRSADCSTPRDTASPRPEVGSYTAASPPQAYMVGGMA